MPRNSREAVSTSGFLPQELSFLDSMRASAQMIAGVGVNLSKKNANSYRQIMQRERPLLERAMQDDSQFFQTVDLLKTLQTATKNFPIRSKTLMRNFIRDLILSDEVLGSIQTHATSLNLTSANRIAVQQLLFGATVGSDSVEEVEKLASAAILYKDPQDNGLHETVRRFKDRVQSLDFTVGYTTAGIASQLTKASSAEVASLGRITLGGEIGEIIPRGETAEDFYRRRLGDYGFQPEEVGRVFSAWGRSTSKIDISPNERRITRDEAFFLHYSRVKRLEELHFNQSASVTLARDFGIYDFGRYPESILIRQFEQRGEKNAPYVVAVLGRGDWNNFMFGGTQLSAMDELQRQLNGLGYELRIIEAENGAEARQRFQQLHSMYPPAAGKNLIAGMLIFAHGGNDGVYLGSNEEGYNRQKDRILPADIKAIKPYFRDIDPPVVVVSCETGLDGGIGSEFSLANVIVTAPTKSTHLQRISVEKFNDGRLRFVPVFSKSDHRIFIAGRSVAPGTSDGYAHMLRRERRRDARARRRNNASNL